MGRVSDSVWGLTSNHNFFFFFFWKRNKIFLLGKTQRLFQDDKSEQPPIDLFFLERGIKYQSQGTSHMILSWLKENFKKNTVYLV